MEPTSSIKRDSSMRHIFLFILLFSLLVPSASTFAADDPKAASAPAAREQLAADTPRTTPDGATFVAPGGWWIETRGNAVILTPEGDSRIALVDVRAKDAYAVSPNEHRAVGARAAKRGEAFTVMIFDMDIAVAEKRGGQIATIFDRL